MRVLVTGCAGFIGAAVTRRLLERGDTVFGIDNLSEYYDVGLKQARLASMKGIGEFDWAFWDIEDPRRIKHVLWNQDYDAVVHMAAQAGVRHSIMHPHDYLPNISGFLNVLEGCRHHQVPRLVYASSSSVYGDSPYRPYQENDRCDHPLSLYAATKRATELMAESYSHLYRINGAGLRFFTVFGPWGRPDMAMSVFAQRIMAGEPVEAFNQGDHVRDFTYIDDAVDAVVAALDRPIEGHQGHFVYNIAGGTPTRLLDLIQWLGEDLGREVQVVMKPLQPGDIRATGADISRAHTSLGWAPKVATRDGVKKFVAWFRDYYSGDCAAKKS